MRFADRLKKVVRDNFLDVAPTEAEIAAAKAAQAEERAAREAREQVQAEAFAAQLAADAENQVQGDSPLASAFMLKELDVNALVSADGAVDFEGLFACTNPPLFSAAQAESLITALPMDLPLRVKRLNVKTSVEQMAEAKAVSPAGAMQSIVSDAAQKMLRVARLQEAVEEQVREQKAQGEATLFQLQAQDDNELAFFREQTESETQEFFTQAQQEIAELENETGQIATQIAELRAQIADLEYTAGRLTEKVLEKATLIETVAAQNETKCASYALVQSEEREREAEAQTEHQMQAETRSETVRKACREQMNALNDVVLFFDEAAMAASGKNPAPAAAEVSGDPEELPAFLREDTAMKLLGIGQNTPVLSPH